MRRIDSAAIKGHADLRFRSEYDYALFEYFRSAKVFAFLDQSGVRLEGRVCPPCAKRSVWVLGGRPGAMSPDYYRNFDPDPDGS